MASDGRKTRQLSGAGFITGIIKRLVFDPKLNYIKAKSKVFWADQKVWIGINISPKVVSKPQIRFKGKASRGLKTERTRQYVSISIRGTTPPLGLRWGFEIISILDYRKMAQNAIYSELVSEGMALNYCGSALYDFWSSKMLNLRGLITGGIYFIWQLSANNYKIKGLEVHRIWV